MVGAGEWDTAADAEVELPDDERPLALVACSSEFQDDGAIAAAALAGLRDRWRLVVTTAGVDPATLGDPGDAVVARFLPHGPLLREADVVVCHGGMGITQKALAAGVPVCVVPWGRDQLEVAAHVVEAEAGTASPAVASPAAARRRGRAGARLPARGRPRPRRLRGDRGIRHRGRRAGSDRRRPGPLTGGHDRAQPQLPACSRLPG